jgi:hypothetical protein
MNGVRNFATTIVLAGLVTLALEPCVTSAHEIAPAQQTVENNGFKFNLQNCLRSGKAVTCNLLVTNTSDKDRSFILAEYACRVFDFSGNEYLSTGTKAGRSQGTYHHPSNVVLLRDVPTKANIKFELPTEVSDLKILSIVGYEGYQAGKVEFRDIAITIPKR